MRLRYPGTHRLQIADRASVATRGRAPGLRAQLGPPLASRTKRRAGSRLPWLLGMAGWLLPALAGAQPAAAPQGAIEAAAMPSTAPSAVVPPRLLSAPEAPYPPGATGDASVVLTVTVDATGSVREAAPVEQHEPFSSAAVRAALAYRFEPATRNGVAVAAKIRMRVDFTAPREAAAPPPDAAPAPAPGAAPRHDRPADQVAGAAPIEVVVRGEQLPPATQSIARGEVRQLPGAFGDAFRAVEILPGVIPAISGLPYFYVRGAPPANVGYILDGVRVPLLYHFAAGPSVVHPALVERVDLYPGGYPARYGRYVGGIVAAETAEPRPELHGEGNIRLFDAGAMVEAPFADGRGTVLLGGRYSYTAAVVSLIAPDAVIDYRDYQARLTYDVTPDDRLTVFSFGSYDLLGEERDDGLSILFGVEFYRLDLRYRHRFQNGELRLGALLGLDRTALEGNRTARDHMLATRADFIARVHPDAEVRLGVDGSIDAYATDIVGYTVSRGGSKRLEQQFGSRDDAALGAHADVVLKLSPRFELTAGVRADLFASGGATAVGVDGRLASRLDVTKRLRLVNAFGVAHQPPSTVAPLPGVQVAGLRGGLQKSAQGSAGVEADLPEGVTAGATAFHNAFFDMTDALGAVAHRWTDDVDDLADVPRTLGSSYGIELYARRRLTRKLGGFASYTLSRSTQAAGRSRSPAPFDRTHVANLALTYQLDRNWRAGARFLFYTGSPGASLAAEERDGSGEAPRIDRDPPFYRLDARIERRWSIGERGWISAVLEGMNVTAKKEVIGGEAIGPVTIPSIGVEGGL
ncbi:TonB-dependent receptor domain-containing protein [Sorangium sp. So ce385]|uniref:TonB-dependent receptor domain-containing protein n=1 Tax=Sorangium sp. So ce385 TaxID=3133308 RepID=UPI003F5C5F99